MNENTQAATEARSVNDWIADIHALAVEKGWWDGERDDDAVIALIHSEWSEALEEYRNEKPMVYEVDGKPEGIAVELIDGCIRILDYLGSTNASLDGTIMDTAHRLLVVRDWTLPRLIRELHIWTAWHTPDTSAVLHTYHLRIVIDLVVIWLASQDIDAEEIMRMKHEYNKTRPYRHGGKAC